MNSYQITWTINTVEVGTIGGYCYVMAKNSADAKRIVEAYIRSQCATLTSCKFGRASVKDAPREEQYI